MVSFQLTVAPGKSGAAPFLNAPVNVEILNNYVACAAITLQHYSRRFCVNHMPLFPGLQSNVFFIRKYVCKYSTAVNL